jgi:hypothetical protein
MTYKPLWKQVPIPLSMILRGLLPKWLGGEMIYEAVIRTNHFGDVDLLLEYLIAQQITATMRCETFHVMAIGDHIHAILDGLKAEKAKLQVA